MQTDRLAGRYTDKQTKSATVQWTHSSGKESRVMGEDDLRDGITSIVEWLSGLVLQCESIQHTHCAIGEPNHCNSRTYHSVTAALLPQVCNYFCLKCEYSYFPLRCEHHQFFAPEVRAVFSLENMNVIIFHPRSKCNVQLFFLEK